MDDINSRIDEIAKEELIDLKNGRDIVDETETEVEEARPVDIYKQNAKKRKSFEDQTSVRGASTLTKKIAEEALGELARAHKRAEVDSDFYKSRGEDDKAKMIKDQYIEEKFLPSVEMVIIASTPDEVLNSKDILKAFDELSMEYGPGYTASYIRTAYGDQLGNATSQSDGYVKENVERIKYLSATDQIRSAYGLAKKLKDEIDNGEHTADDNDYEIIARVVSIN